MFRSAVSCRFCGGSIWGVLAIAGLVVVATLLAWPGAAPAAQQGPVAAWSLDAGEGTTAEDVTGDGHEGTIEGPGWTGHGRFGDALEFSGEEGECVTVPESEALQPAEEVTLEAWVRPSAVPDDDPIVFKEGGGSLGYAMGIGISSEGRPEGLIGEGEGEAEEVVGPKVIEPHVWAHLAFTYDGAHMRLYVDGELLATRAMASPPPATPGTLSIGCDPLHPETFDGRIDEVKVYERALSGAEIAADMGAPLQTPASSPVAAYSFDAGEGTNLEDVTGDGHEGTIEGAGWTTHGRFGDALEFSGEEGECVTVPDSEDLDLGEEFTLEAWVRPDSLEDAPILYKEGEGAIGYALGIGLLSEGRPEGFIGEGGGNYADAAATAVEAGVWTHLAFTYDGAHMRVYEDGELAGQDTQASGPLAAGGPLKIGCNPNYPETFDGRIDEVRIYERALSEGEIGADRSNPIQTPRRGPVAAYSLDEGEGTTATDASGDGHEGTIEGPEWTRGRYGAALRFVQNEGRQCVTVADSPDLRLEEGFTLEAWVRPEEWLGGSAIVSKELEPGSGQSYSLGIGLTEYGRVEGWSSYEPVYSPEPVEEDVWTHVAFTYDGARARIYLDGALVSEKVVGPVELASTGPLDIGCNSEELGAQFSGRIDEVRLYGRALDEGEIDYDMEAPIQTPKKGPVAAYSFGEGEGTTVEDVTGDGHTATIHGADRTTRGRYGGAMEFDAANESYLSVPDSPELDLTEEFTLEAWARPESGSNEWAPILAKEIGGGESAEELAWWLYEGGRDSNEPDGGTEPAPGEKDEAHAPDPLPVDAWSHVALTYDGAEVRLYIDGELVDCSPVPAGPPPATEGELQIGGATESGDFFTGRIDEVRVYDRALREGEIETDMNTPLPVPPTAVTGSAEVLGPSEAIFTGTVDPNETETSYRFEYGTTTAYGQMAPAIEEEVLYETAGQEAEEAVAYLQPDTTYHYRVVATNPAGTAVGEDKTLTTPPSELSPEQEAQARKQEEDYTGSISTLPPDFVGLNFRGLQERTNAQMEKVAETGASMYRISIENLTHFSAERSKYDEVFLNAAAHHMKVLFVLGSRHLSTSKSGLTTWVERIVRRYGKARAGMKGSVWTSKKAPYAPTAWEVWNEPNIGLNALNTPPQPDKRFEALHPDERPANLDPKKFGDYLEVMSKAIKSKNAEPEATVILGGLLWVGNAKRNIAEERSLEGDTLNPMRFLREMGHPDAYDAVGFHPYVFKVGKPSHAPQTGEQASQVRIKIRSAIRLVRLALNKLDGGTEKELWITEVGWPVGVGDSAHPAVTPEIQAELVKSVFSTIKEKAEQWKIANAFYYDYRDKGGTGWEDHTGLLDGAGEPRPAFEAFKLQTE